MSNPTTKNTSETKVSTKRKLAETSSGGEVLWHIVPLRIIRDRRHKWLPTLCGRYLRRGGTFTSAKASAKTLSNRVMCPMCVYEFENTPRD